MVSIVKGKTPPLLIQQTKVSWRTIWIIQNGRFHRTSSDLHAAVEERPEDATGGANGFKSVHTMHREGLRH